MYKIKDEIIKYFYREDLTGCDQLTYIALRKICNEEGVVKGCHYKEIVEMTEYSEGQFYRSLNALSERNLITVSDDRGEKTVYIINNKFNNFEKLNKYRSYCDTNLKLYDTKEYKELRAGARRLLEYFVFRVLKQRYKTEEKERRQKKKNGEKLDGDNNTNTLIYTIDKRTGKSEIHMFEKINKEVFSEGLTLRMYKSYIDELKKSGFISVGYKIDINGRKYDTITVSAVMLHTPNVEVIERGAMQSKEREGKHGFHVHMIKFWCRILKLTFDNINLMNTADLFVQYRKIALQKKKDLYSVMKTAIFNFSENNGLLDSKVIHAIVKKVMAKDYDNSLLIYE